jgi:hypothetical protein
MGRADPFGFKSQLREVLGCGHIVYWGQPHPDHTVSNKGTAISLGGPLAAKIASCNPQFVVLFLMVGQPRDKATALKAEAPHLGVCEELLMHTIRVLQLTRRSNYRRRLDVERRRDICTNGRQELDGSRLFRVRRLFRMGFEHEGESPLKR